LAERSIVEAVNDCLHVDLERDSSVMVMGEDVGRAGGVFRATAGLRDRFGPDRCFDTPLAEAGILGTAVGLCMAGWRPVCEMQYDAFSYPCLDQLIRGAVSLADWREDGVSDRRADAYGGGVRAPELHDDSPETYYVHTPGVKLAIPSTPADAKGLLAAAIRDPDPVVILEPKLHYRTIKGEVPEGEHVVPLGKARLALEGDDVTLVAYGSMVAVCEAAAAALEGVSVEVLDIRSLKPLDEDALLASAAKTGRVVIVGGAAHVWIRGRVGRCWPRRRSSTCAARCCVSPATTSPIRTGRSRTRTCRRRSASSRLPAVYWSSRQGRTNELRHEFSNRRPPFDVHRRQNASTAHLSVDEKSHIRDERRVRFSPKDTSRRATVGTVPSEASQD
jgi:pyruvate/2-oxoglutarate/acetoin dehydrogenase E1 component